MLLKADRFLYVNRKDEKTVERDRRARLFRRNTLAYITFSSSSQILIWKLNGAEPSRNLAFVVGSRRF